MGELGGQGPCLALAQDRARHLRATAEGSGDLRDPGRDCPPGGVGKANLMSWPLAASNRGAGWPGGERGSAVLLSSAASARRAREPAGSACLPEAFAGALQPLGTSVDNQSRHLLPEQGTKIA